MRATVGGREGTGDGGGYRTTGRAGLRNRPRDEARMSLAEHLEEFRSRILKAAVAFVVVAIGAAFFVEEIFRWLLAPSGLNGLAFLGPSQGLLTDVKLVLYAAFVLTIPVLLYQGWMFVAPAVGTLGRMKTYVLVGLASSLFLAGIAFGYYLVLPMGLEFLLGYAPDRYEEVITADTYLPFVTRFLLAFGVVFELPAAALVGAWMGLLTAGFLRGYRRHALVVNAVLAAALTPGQDPISMVMMAVPMILMYEASIFIVRFVNPEDGDGREEGLKERDL